jgi:hypothetical protein
MSRIRGGTVINVCRNFNPRHLRNPRLTFPRSQPPANPTDENEGNEAGCPKSLLPSLPAALSLPTGSSALQFVARIIRVDEQRFYLLLEMRIAGTGAFHHGRPPKCIIAFDGIGQNCFHLLPALRSHKKRGGQPCQATGDKKQCLGANLQFAIEGYRLRRRRCRWCRSYHERPRYNSRVRVSRGSRPRYRCSAEW